MDEKLRNRLLRIAVGGLLAAAVLFAALSIFFEPERRVYLLCAAVCAALAGLFEQVRRWGRKSGG